MNTVPPSDAPVPTPEDRRQFRDVLEALRQMTHCRVGWKKHSLMQTCDRLHIPFEAWMVGYIDPTNTEGRASHP